MSKVVLITGATGGLGREVVRYFAGKNWQIIASAHEPVDDEIARLPSCQYIPCDCTDPMAVEELVSKTPDTLHAVVHLVGGIRAGMLLEETSPDDFEFMWRLNALSTYAVLRATVPRLKQNAGAFVAIAAKTVLHTEQRKALYGAAKAAVVHLVLAAAEEGRAQGMRANVIAPSIIATPANIEWARERESEQWVPPQQIAQLIHFLCSDEGQGITGCVIPMYGKIPA
ncbi:MAG: SDR family oxidoreductase [Bacteroidota bacterium]|nr:SDR family oxidoreductase [Candidatus Kapabacteria bacterium]MCS7303120.1 SDR family oxidoreductase [Candidatus Kapabacteria bacterium]MCX7936268.1 SDR family oxidoreductase [Chlorobiota bacterium]MDW8074451.1 SDR family oxidoreductase [Bacteroidota bacterium]MDW8271073.1 SDR family oxidoreductase [Bacteroidota bacterium]